MNIRRCLLSMIFLLVFSSGAWAKDCQYGGCTMEEFREWYAEDQKEQKQQEYKDKQLEYQAQQLEIQRQQLELNRRNEQRENEILENQRQQEDYKRVNEMFDRSPKYAPPNDRVSCEMKCEQKGYSAYDCWEFCNGY